MTATTPKYMAVQAAALLVAGGFILIGVLGFIPGVTTDYGLLDWAGPHSGAKLFGVFAISGLHNVIHLVSGVVGVALARTYAASRAYFLGGGLVYLAFWLQGWLMGRRSADLLPVNGPDNWLHFGIGVVMGVVAGFFGGWVDSVIARAMDIFLAFPLLVFAIALVGVVPSSAFGLSGNSLRIGLLIFVIGFFAWPYMGRIIRGQTLSLREREFVDAARSLGARGPYILFRELLPNLVGPILVYSTLLIPTNILFEAALSYLGVGIIPPTPSWGGMISDAVNNGIYSVDPMYMIIPGLAIFITVLAFNLFGDGLRDALDPKLKK